jgi:hypothetical protein
MPSMDAFLGLQLEDENGIWSWLLAHKCRHSIYSQAAASHGVNAQTYDFGASRIPDDDWFQRHMNAHVALQSFMPPDPTNSINALTLYAWDTDDDFQSWMQAHMLLHRLLDEAFEIFS